jgi:6-pyruvoyltetrahydropterin/6-carboxytetrahydropterin synthase
MIATVCKVFDFPAAHANGHHAGRCSGVHGHTWVLEVFARGMVSEDESAPDFGMVVDFDTLKHAYRERVEPYVEHAYLNESLADFELPEITSEWLAWWILQRLSTAVPAVHRVRLWEGRSSYVELELAPAAQVSSDSAFRTARSDAPEVRL